jgi:DNA-binding Xre family transcriptional regulator
MDSSVVWAGRVVAFGPRPSCEFRDWNDSSAGSQRTYSKNRIYEDSRTPLAVRLAELRQARSLSQAELAERAGLTQANLSRVENQDDMKLGTLQKIVTAMAASLSIVAKFPDGSNWELRV